MPDNRPQRDNGSSEAGKVMKREVCGKEFAYGYREDGLPNGMTFILQNGTKMTMCADCIMEKGREVAEEKAQAGGKN